MPYLAQINEALPGDCVPILRVHSGCFLARFFKLFDNEAQCNVSWGLFAIPCVRLTMTPGPTDFHFGQSLTLLHKQGVSSACAVLPGSTHVSTADFPMPLRHSMSEPAVFDEVTPQMNRKIS